MIKLLIFIPLISNTPSLYSAETFQFNEKFPPAFLHAYQLLIKGNGTGHLFTLNDLEELTLSGEISTAKWVWSAIEIQKIR